MSQLFASTEEARAKAIELASVDFVRTFTKEYDRLVASGAISEAEILEGYRFAKCVLCLQAENYGAATDSKKMLKNLRRF